MKYLLEEFTSMMKLNEIKREEFTDFHEWYGTVADHGYTVRMPSGKTDDPDKTWYAKRGGEQVGQWRQNDSGFGPEGRGWLMVAENASALKEGSDYGGVQYRTESGIKVKYFKTEAEFDKWMDDPPNDFLEILAYLDTGYGRPTSESVKIINEGYEKVVRNLLNQNGIQTAVFDSGVLYVDREDMLKAAEIIDNDPNVFKTPVIKPIESLYEGSSKINEGTGAPWTWKGAGVVVGDDGREVDLKGRNARFYTGSGIRRFDATWRGGEDGPFVIKTGDGVTHWFDTPGEFIEMLNRTDAVFEQYF